MFCTSKSVCCKLLYKHCQVLKLGCRECLPERRAVRSGHPPTAQCHPLLHTCRHLGTAASVGVSSTGSRAGRAPLDRWHGTGWQRTARHSRRTPSTLSSVNGAASAQHGPNSPQRVLEGARCCHPGLLPCFLIRAAFQVKALAGSSAAPVLPCLHNSHSLGKVSSEQGQQQGYS